MKNLQKVIVIAVVIVLGGVTYFINKDVSAPVDINISNPVPINTNSSVNTNLVTNSTTLPPVLDPCKLVSAAEVSQIASGVDTATNIGKNCTFSIGKAVYRKTSILDYSISVEDPKNYPQSFSEYIKAVCGNGQSCADVSQSGYQAFWVGSSLQASYKGYRIVSPNHGLNTKDQVEKLLKLVVSKL